MWWREEWEYLDENEKEVTEFHGKTDVDEIRQLHLYIFISLSH